MSREGFAPAAKLLHWAIAGMLVLQFVLARLAESAEDVSPTRELALLANHKSVGISILILAIVRLGWRKFQAPPAPLPMPQWQQHASMISHWLLYGLLFLLPISGWLMVSAAADSVSWFNTIQLPDLVGPDPAIEDVLEEVHETFAKILFLLASIHILAALKHSLYDKDGAIGRISSAISIALFLGVIVLGVITLTSTNGA
jgi:cytochrome b561